MRGTRLWLTLGLSALFATAMIAAGCGSSDDSGGGGGGSSDLGLINDGELLVGSDIPYPPFEQGNPPDYKGFDIDIVNAIADKMNLDVTYQDTAFGTIFSDLQAGKFDMVASSTTITPSREERVTFSKPYFAADQSLMVKKGSDIKTTKDLSGETVAVQQGTTGQDYAENETSAGNVATFPEVGDAFNALQNEQVDAVINDFPVSAYAQKSYPRPRRRGDDPDRRVLRVPRSRRTNKKLIDAVNAALDDVIDDGTYAKVFEKWFQEKPPKEFQAAG